MLTFKKREKTKQQGWILLETLFSLVLLVIVLHLVQQQTQEHWQTISQLEEKYQQRFQQTQIDKLRRLKQDPTWLVGQWTSPTESECLECEGTELNNWALYWLSAKKAYEQPNGQSNQQIELNTYLSQE